MTAKQKLLQQLEVNRYDLSAAMRNSGAEFERITLSLKVGAKIHLTVMIDTLDVVKISSSKGDYRSNDMQPDGTLGKNHGFGKHHHAMEYLAKEINQVGLSAAIARIGQGVTCPFCGSPLTDELSVARGIGPVCWQRAGQSGRVWSKVIHRIAERNETALGQLSLDEMKAVLA